MFSIDAPPNLPIVRHGEESEDTDIMLRSVETMHWMGLTGVGVVLFVRYCC